MRKIGAKIYYDISDGSIVTVIGERTGNVVEMSKSEEVAEYTALSGYEVEDVDFVQLEYGELGPLFQKHSGQRLVAVDIANQSLIWEPIHAE